MATSVSLPFDYQDEIDQQTRQRAMAELLLQRSMAPVTPQQIGPVAAKVSPLAILAQSGAAALSSLNLEKADSAIRGTKQRFDNDQRSALTDYLGQPVDTRIDKGLASKFPGVQGIAGKEREQRDKRFDSVLTTVGKNNPNIAIGMAQSNKLPIEAIPAENIVVNNQLVPKNATGDYRDQFKAPTVLPGLPGQQAMQVQEGPGGKLAVLRGATNVSAHASASGPLMEREFEKNVGKNDADQLIEARKNVQSSQGMVAMANQLRELDKQGVFSGPAATPQMFLAGVGRALKLPVDENLLANSQQYQRQFSKQIAVALTGAAGRSLTDADRKRIEDSLPNLMQSPAAREQIYRELESEGKANVSRHAMTVQTLSKRYPRAALESTYDPTFGTPAVGGGPTNPAVVPGLPSKETANLPRVTDAQGNKFVKINGIWTADK